MADGLAALLASLADVECVFDVEKAKDGTEQIQVEIDYPTVVGMNTFETVVGIPLALYVESEDSSLSVVVTIECEELNAIYTFFMPGKAEFGIALSTVISAMVPNADREYAWRGGAWHDIYSAD